jgi:NADPH:quinone reductase-like Zn-dependent oxidoreductase
MQLACAMTAGLGAALSAQAAQSPVPAQQQAMVQTGAGAQSLRLQSIPVPQPAAGQVLIRVYDASVNPADWAQLSHPAADEAAGHNVPGLDVSGVIAAVGPGVTDRPVGMPVFGMVDRGDLNGGYAHYALAKASSTAPKPRSVDYAQAAGLGVVGVTALRAVDLANVQSGQRVLITGIAGGVGSTAAQIAITRGATVVGTASARHEQFLHRLGVATVIDYTRGNIAGQAGSVDAVIDTVGGDEAVQAFQAIRHGGHFVSTARAHVSPAQCVSAQVQCFGSPGHAADAPVAVLLQVAQLAGEGKLREHVDRTFPLAQAAEAVQYVHEGHTEGKVVLAVQGR